LVAAHASSMDALRHELAERDAHERALTAELGQAAAAGQGLLYRTEDLERENAKKERELEHLRGGGDGTPSRISRKSRMRSRQSRTERGRSSSPEGAMTKTKSMRKSAHKKGDSEGIQLHFDEVLQENHALEQEKFRLEADKTELARQFDHEHHLVEELRAAQRDALKRADRAERSERASAAPGLMENQQARGTIQNLQSMHEMAMHDLEDKFEHELSESQEQLYDLAECLQESHHEAMQLKSVASKSERELEEKTLMLDDIEEEMDDMREILEDEKFKNSAFAMRLTTFTRKSNVTGGVKLARGAQSGIGDALALAAELAMSNSDTESSPSTSPCSSPSSSRGVPRASRKTRVTRLHSGNRLTAVEELERANPLLAAQRKHLNKKLWQLQHQTSELEKLLGVDALATKLDETADVVISWMQKEPRCSETGTKASAMQSKPRLTRNTSRLRLSGDASASARPAEEVSCLEKDAANPGLRDDASASARPAEEVSCLEKDAADPRLHDDASASARLAEEVKCLEKEVKLAAHHKARLHEHRQNQAVLSDLLSSWRSYASEEARQQRKEMLRDLEATRLGLQEKDEELRTTILKREGTQHDFDLARCELSEMKAARKQADTGGLPSNAAVSAAGPDHSELSDDIARLAAEVEAARLEAELLRKEMEKPSPTLGEMFLEAMWCGGRKVAPEDDGKIMAPQRLAIAGSKQPLDPPNAVSAVYEAKVSGSS